MSETLPWNLPLPRLLAELGSTPEGLSAREVERRLAKYGPNDALLHRRRPLWRQILDRFANPLILILLFASGLSAWTGEVTSFALIVGIILLSVVLDVVQQARAEIRSTPCAGRWGSRPRCSATARLWRSPSTGWCRGTWSSSGPATSCQAIAGFLSPETRRAPGKAA